MFSPPTLPAAFHLLAILVLLYPRAKHISSFGHSQDQWRGKAQERLKSRERPGRRAVAVRGSAIKKRRDQAVYSECNLVNMYVQLDRGSERESAKRFI